jgi:hypothetical protein
MIYVGSQFGFVGSILMAIGAEDRLILADSGYWRPNPSRQSVSSRDPGPPSYACEGTA